MDVLTEFALTVSLIALATAAGYAARRLRILPEQSAEPIMTAVAVLGYPAVGFFAIWRISPGLSDLLVPALAMLQVLVLALICLPVSRLFAKDRPERGLFAIASAAGNWGFTMGAFVIYIIYRTDGLGLASIYCMMFTPALVLIMYPIARHFTGAPGGVSLGRLMVRSLFDFRSLGLATSIAALCLSLAGVRPAEFIDRYKVIDVLMLTLIPVAYFSIGLRLHASHIGPMKKMLVGLAGTRFALSLLVGLAILAVMDLTAWPLVGLKRNVFIMQSLVPTAVSMVAVANMFGLRPRTGSVLFVFNSLIYLIFVLPLILLAFG